VRCFEANLQSKSSIICTVTASQHIVITASHQITGFGKQDTTHRKNIESGLYTERREKHAVRKDMSRAICLDASISPSMYMQKPAYRCPYQFMMNPLPLPLSPE
jgi:hypothetical protein